MKRGYFYGNRTAGSGIDDWSFILLLPEQYRNICVGIYYTQSSWIFSICLFAAFYGSVYSGSGYLFCHSHRPLGAHSRKIHSAAESWIQRQTSRHYAGFGPRNFEAAVHRLSAWHTVQSVPDMLYRLGVVRRPLRHWRHAQPAGQANPNPEKLAQNHEAEVEIYLELFTYTIRYENYHGGLILW